MKRAAAVAVAMSLGFSSSGASADPAPADTSLEVAVGETASISVGFARGLQCDDVTIIHAELRADTGTSNLLVIKGLKPGSTDCRVGTMGPPTMLVHVTVKAPSH